MLAGLLRLPLYLPSAPADVEAAPAGVALTVGLGAPTVAVVQSQSASPAGVGIALALGTAAASVEQSATAAPAGVAVALALGVPTVTIVASGAATPVGVAITVALGVAVGAVTQSAVASPAGLGITVTLGAPTASVAQSATAAPAGVGVTLWLGTVTADATGDDPLVIIGGPVSSASGVGAVASASGFDGVAFSAPGLSGAIAAGVRFSGPITVYAGDLSVALDEPLRPLNDYCFSLGPLAKIINGVLVPAPATGETITAFIADTDDLLDATAIGTLTVTVSERLPDNEAEYDGAFQGADLAADPTLLAALDNTLFHVHARNASGSYSVSWPVPWQRTRVAEEG